MQDRLSYLHFTAGEGQGSGLRPALLNPHLKLCALHPLQWETHGWADNLFEQHSELSSLIHKFS